MYSKHTRHVAWCLVCIGFDVFAFVLKVSTRKQGRTGAQEACFRKNPVWGRGALLYLYHFYMNWIPCQCFFHSNVLWCFLTGVGTNSDIRSRDTSLPMGRSLGAGSFRLYGDDIVNLSLSKEYLSTTSGKLRRPGANACKKGLLLKSDELYNSSPAG